MGCRGPIRNYLMLSGALNKSAKFTFGEAVSESPATFVVAQRIRGAPDYEEVGALCTPDLIPGWFWMTVPNAAIELESVGYVDFRVLSGDRCARVHVDVWPRGVPFVD